MRIFFLPSFIKTAKKQCLQKLVAYTIPSNNEHGRARPQEQRLKEKMNNEADLHKNVDKVTMHSMPSTDQWAVSIRNMNIFQH